MPRQPILALGLLTTLALVVGAAGRSASADEPAAKPAQGHAEPAKAAHPEPAAGHAAPAPAAGHAAPAGEAGHAPAAGGHDEQKIDILKLDFPLAIWTVVVFGLLVLILGKFAWGPILQALHDREEHMHNALSDAEKARNEAERIMVENRKQLAGAADEVRALIEQGRADAQAVADSIVKKAQAEAEAALHRAEREIGSARDQALTEIFSKSADLAVSVAGKVLAKELGPDDHRRLVDAAMSELPAASNGREVTA